MRGGALPGFSLVLAFLVPFAMISFELVNLIKDNQALNMLTREVANAAYRECYETLQEAVVACDPSTMIADPETVPNWTDEELTTVDAASKCRQHLFQDCFEKSLDTVEAITTSNMNETEIRLTISMPVLTPTEEEPDKTTLFPIYAAAKNSEMSNICSLSEGGAQRCTYSEETHNELLGYSNTEILVIAETVATNEPIVFPKTIFAETSYEVTVF